MGDGTDSVSVALKERPRTNGFEFQQGDLIKRWEELPDDTKNCVMEQYASERGRLSSSRGLEMGAELPCWEYSGCHSCDQLATSGG